MSKQFYRFRSLKSLFEFEELEKQEIYFASPTELNDPMEGFRDLVFNGDKIVWKNFFRHYLLCLEHVSSLFIISGEEHHSITENDIPIFRGFDEFPTPMYKELFEKISKEFFILCGDFIDKISIRTTAIRRDELSLYLNVIHMIAVELIEKNYVEKKFIEQRKTPYRLDNKMFNELSKMIDVVEQMINEKDHHDKIDVLFFIQRAIQNDILLNRNVNDNIILKTPNRKFLLIDFVDKYLNNIEKLMYPEWYTACFMTECINSSVWGHYGDNHKGICLIFEADKKNRISFDENTSGLEFKAMEYKEIFEEIDFFKSIGSLSIDKLISTWYMNENKVVSDIYNGFSDNQDKWRNNYWDKFYKSILTKTKDWKYEKEYRLILSSGLNQEMKKESRLLKYSFTSLKGIVFGIRTSMEDKLKIIKIIEQRCKENNRKDFEFYQAHYCHLNKNIQHRKMSFIKFDNDVGK